MKINAIILIGILIVVAKTTYAGMNINLPNCDYQITFPGKPSINDLFISENTAYKQAEYLKDEIVLRAECIPFKPNQEQLKKLMFKFGSSDGLNNMQLMSGFDNTGKWLKLRGYKKLGAAYATYEIKAYYGLNSLLVIYAGTLSEKYPTDEIAQFISSGAKLK